MSTEKGWFLFRLLRKLAAEPGRLTEDVRRLVIRDLQVKKGRDLAKTRAAAFQEAARSQLWYFRTYREVLNAIAEAGFDPVDGTIAFVGSGASRVQADGLPAFGPYAEIMAFVQGRGHAPADVAQGFALVKLRRT